MTQFLSRLNVSKLDSCLNHPACCPADLPAFPVVRATGKPWLQTHARPHPRPPHTRLFLQWLPAAVSSPFPAPVFFVTAAWAPPAVPPLTPIRGSQTPYCAQRGPACRAVSFPSRHLLAPAPALSSLFLEPATRLWSRDFCTSYSIRVCLSPASRLPPSPLSGRLESYLIKGSPLHCV